MTAPDWVTPDVMSQLKTIKDFELTVRGLTFPHLTINNNLSAVLMLTLFVHSLSQSIFGLYKQQEKSRLQGGMCL